jgi:hypothetical protein
VVGIMRRAGGGGGGWDKCNLKYSLYLFCSVVIPMQECSCVTVLVISIIKLLYRSKLRTSLVFFTLIFLRRVFF